MSLNDRQNPHALSLELSEPESTLLASSSHNKNMDMVGDDEESVTTESPQPASPSYGELLEVMALAAKTLDLV